MCPKVYGRFENGIAYGFIPGRPFEVRDMSDPVLSHKFARTLAQWHKVQIGGEKKPQLFMTLTKWIANIPESFSSKEVEAQFRKNFSLTKINREFRFLQEELPKLNSPCVFSHNDLLSGNILYDQTLGQLSRSFFVLEKKRGSTLLSCNRQNLTH